MRRTLPALAALAVVASGIPLATAGSADSGAATGGTLGRVISQPGTRPECFTAQYNPSDGYRCPPAAMAVTVLPTGKVLFWDGLEGMNKVQLNVVAEFGDVAQDDQSRVASFSGDAATFTTPGNQTGAPTDGHSDPVNPLVPDPSNPGVADSAGNNYDLFCSPLVQLWNGSVLSAGGTHYYLEPGVTDPSSGKGYGVSELQGLKATRIFDPQTGSWHNAKGDLHFGRWYPTMVTLPDGHVFIASGVTKLIKPAYTDGRAPQDSGRNVVQTETYDPTTQQWTLNQSNLPGTDPTLADASQQSLPLFPRLHLLPDGKVYYDAAGQTFNPDGQAYDEANWVYAKVYDPATQAWSNLAADTPTGLPLVDGAPVGFRGSGFSVMLPLAPDKDGSYTTARVFNGGGVVGPTPGSYVGDSSTTINTIDTANGTDTLHSASGPNLLNGRWYGSAVVLPDGEVFLTNGANRDEVVGPGTGNPVTQTELIDPTAGTVTAGPSLADGHGRTYHNSAILLPDARVLVGGHAPIATGYAFQSDAGSAAGLSAPEADSTFQIYSPPYLSYGVPRPVIQDVDSNASWNRPFNVETADATSIGKVVLVRDPAVTHLTDGDQRTVELRIVKRSGEDLTVAVPGSAVLPPGPYMLFIERTVSVGGATKYVPSVSREVFVGTPPPDYLKFSHDAGAVPAKATAAPVARTSGAHVAEAPPVSRPERVSLHATPMADHRRSAPATWLWAVVAGVGLAAARGLARRGRRE